MKSKNILVTGGGGFIGSHLVDKLIKNDCKVSIIDDLSGGKKANINPKAKFYLCDLREVIKTDKIIKKIQPEIVFHLAANAAENKAQFSPIDITSRNWNTFINTLVSSLNNGMKRIIVTSSIAVYGSLQTPFKETNKPEPEDLYGISKLAMEEALKVLSKVHKFEYVITRPHNVYGPRQNMNDPYRNVVTIFMNALMKNEPYYIYGDGTQRRCFSYIDDVVEALFNAGFGNFHGMTFNIGADRDYSINQLSQIIQKVSKKNIDPICINERPQEVKIAIADHSLAKKYLGYQDKTPLIKGLELTWEYAKKLGSQEYIFDKVELDSPLLPKNWRKVT
ncbi:MAG: NAD-dependent epimerase/dehydratase family protein [Candidatus Daviesbacteria bacterium]|nr:NAD-dependent epimerase/dehydratase family protein [Candidatus Daviesbacteria bacterium]